MMVSPIAQLPAAFSANDASSKGSSNLTLKFLTPTRIVKVYDATGKQILNAESFLKPGIGQADLIQGKYLTLISDIVLKPWIILDFGKEIQGGI